MSNLKNYLSIKEASDLANLTEDVFKDMYVSNGVISATSVDGEFKIELSEFFRVFPHAIKTTASEDVNSTLEIQLKQLHIENLEYKVVSLERQLDRQSDEYNWLRAKFDHTTMLLEQKLDTSEVDKYRQELQRLTNQAIQWEKKYNTLLAANELKSLLRENRELKSQINSSMQQNSEEQSIKDESNTLETVERLKSELAIMQQKLNQSTNQEPDESSSMENANVSKKKRRKIFGIF